MWELVKYGHSPLPEYDVSGLFVVTLLPHSDIVSLCCLVMMMVSYSLTVHTVDSEFHLLAAGMLGLKEAVRDILRFWKVRSVGNLTVNIVVQISSQLYTRNHNLPCAVWTTTCPVSMHCNAGLILNGKNCIFEATTILRKPLSSQKSSDLKYALVSG